jgi:atypical dual specificity phosphatase
VWFVLSERSALPKNFSWLEWSRLAGCARPESEAELKGVKEQGIKAIVSLTGTPLIPEFVNRLGFEYLHSHVSVVPTLDRLHDIIQFIEQKNSEGKPVLVHCGEGKGRTGTVLAAYLVFQGMGADEAIRRVREKRPGSIENLEQENVIWLFERVVRTI